MREKDEGQVQTTVGWPATEPQWPLLPTASCSASAALAKQTASTQILFWPAQEFSQTRNCLLKLKAKPVSGISNPTDPPWRLSVHFLMFLLKNKCLDAALAAMLHDIWWHSIVAHLIISRCVLSSFPEELVVNNGVNRLFATFHKLLLNSLTNLYSMRGLLWRVGVRGFTKIPLHPFVFNLFVTGWLCRGARCCIDLCQPSLWIWRNRWQPSMEGAAAWIQYNLGPVADFRSCQFPVTPAKQAFSWVIQHGIYLLFSWREAAERWRERSIVEKCGRTSVRSTLDKHQNTFSFCCTFFQTVIEKSHPRVINNRENKLDQFSQLFSIFV